MREEKQRQEKVFAHVRGKAQWQGEEVWVHVYFWAAGAKACKQGGCMGGGSEGRECRWFYVCAHDEAQHNLCMCTAGTQPGALGWDL